MKKLFAAAGIVVLALSLTGCNGGDDLEELKKDAEYSKLCKAEGGRIEYNGAGSIFCLFNEEY